MNLCSVKKHLHQPPEFSITTSAAPGPDGRPVRSRARAEARGPGEARGAAAGRRWSGCCGSTGAETVVDYGAGTGVYTVAIAEASRTGNCSPSKRCRNWRICFARRSRRSSRTGCASARPDDNVVPLDDGEADRVVMVDVLHHLYDQPEALEEVARVLRPEGLFVVAGLGRRGSTGRPAGRPCARPPAVRARSSPGWASTWSRRTNPVTCCRTTCGAWRASPDTRPAPVFGAGRRPGPCVGANGRAGERRAGAF